MVIKVAAKKIHVNKKSWLSASILFVDFADSGKTVDLITQQLLVPHFYFNFLEPTLDLSNLKMSLSMI